MANILCAGIAVLDEVFRVQAFPIPDTKAEASEFITIGGGCAANAAVAIARLGGKARLAVPLGGPAGSDVIGDRLIDGLQSEGVDCTDCVRIPGARTPVSAIFIDASGDRTIATYRDRRLDAVAPDDPDRLIAGVDAVLVDNRFSDFVVPIGRAARVRRIPLVIDADKPSPDRHPLFEAATHVIFSRECLRATAGTDDLAAGLAHMRRFTNAFLAVTDGPNPVLWRDRDCVTICEMPVFAIEAVDTLGAGDVFHGAFTLALVEGRGATGALRFAAAAAGLKCSRFGGSTAAPQRAEVDALLTHPELVHTARPQPA
ncbi:MAG TPA: PfkB family carbohydrate kinase [Xanthobacteraceae bacterium]|nr:PfkB family carbohydrate kinase [Xanthobacteraceae bacterium]